MTYSFPKSHRLLCSSQFQQVQNRGLRYANRTFVIVSCANELSHPRLGMAVSRKVGKAHERNFLKRRIREIFRRRLLSFVNGHDYVIIARTSASALDFAGIVQNLDHLLKKLPLKASSPPKSAVEA